MSNILLSTFQQRASIFSYLELTLTLYFPSCFTSKEGTSRALFVRLKKYGKKRLAIVHEQENLSDNPRFLLTDALHWEAGRMIETWSYRWACEVFHEFGKQVTGFESAQLRNEEAVTRHFRLSCIAQSLVQSSDTSPSKSEKYSFANGQITFGQKVRSIVRQAWHSLLSLAHNLFAQGQDVDQVLQLLIPT